MNYLIKVYKEAGRPVIRINSNRIHWVPFKFKWDKEINT